MVTEKKSIIILVFNVLFTMGILNLVIPYFEGTNYNIPKLVINCGGLILLVIALVLRLRKENKNIKGENWNGLNNEL